MYANSSEHNTGMNTTSNIRTDLALESQERFVRDNVEIHGVIVEQYDDTEREITVSRVVIESEKGAKAMGKPKGTYITLESPNLAVPDEDYHREVSVLLSKELQKLLPLELSGDCSVLVVGLGNRMVTADSLGPLVSDNLLITRHIVKEYGRLALDKSYVHEISSIVPGVMSQTGMETFEIIKGIIEKTCPDAMIAIDALAARSTKRLNRTIQLADTGIHPGSGVGNHRNMLSKESLGIPVIAIGVPTVVEAAAIIHDAHGDESITPHLNGMYVTPKDIDESVKRLSFTISEGINLALS